MIKVFADAQKNPTALYPFPFLAVYSTYTGRCLSGFLSSAKKKKKKKG